MAATEIEEEPLWDGQAKSSRYQDFSRSGFITPPEFDEAEAPRTIARPAKRCWRRIRRSRAGVRLPARAAAAARKR